MPRTRLTIREWAVGIAVVAIALTITKLVGMSAKWEHAIVDTATIFTAVLIGTRPVWGRGNFWLDLVAIFLFHCVILGGIVQSLPAESAGPHGILMIPAVVVEACFIGGVLWLRSLRSRSDPS